LQPKSEKCIFVGYSEDVKGYRLLQSHCNEIVIIRDVKFDENLLACEPNSVIACLQVLQTNEGIFLSQSKYACDLLRRFHMDDCKPTPSPFQSGVKFSATCTSPEVDATLYRQLVGSLLYLTHTHPNLSFVVGLVARYMQTPHESHWKEAKRILRYVRGTVQFGYITV
jgi:hypothetical protein